MYSSVTPCPPTGTMIRLKKSVLFCMTSCTTLFRSSSSCFASLWQCCVFTLVHACEVVTFPQLRRVARFSKFIACRINVPTRRIPLLLPNGSSSSLHGDSSGQFFPSTAFVDCISFPHPFNETICTASGRQCASRASLADHGHPSGIGYLQFVSVCQPQDVAVFPEVVRERLAIVFHQKAAM